MAPHTRKVDELFHSRGLRLTHQREMLYQVLSHSKSHPTAEELFHSARKSDPGLSLATVYNTLEVFCENGLCQRLACARGTGACRYDADLHEHVHLITSDGRVLDLPMDLGDKVLRRLGAELLTEIETRMGIPLGPSCIQFVAP